MKIRTLSCGDELHYYKKSLVLYFRGKRRVISTGLNHGGCRDDLQAVFNNDGNPDPGMEFRLRAPTYREHLDVIAGQDLGLDPESCTGFCTAASMENVSIQTMEQAYFTVTAIVTGGIEGNGARIGDPASYSEEPNRDTVESDTVNPGTINIILHIDADFPRGTLAKAMVSCAEAKVAALQELLAASRYSRGLATGSGTDGIIVVCNPESEHTLTDAGHHSLLGESIGKTVKAAVKEALYRQTGLSPRRQHDIIRRMDRFGVTSDTLWELYRSDIEQSHHQLSGEQKSEQYPEKLSVSGGQSDEQETGDIPRYEFENRLDQLKTNEMLVTCTSLYAHLLDQIDWGLLSPAEAWKAAEGVLEMAELKRAEGDGSEKMVPENLEQRRTESTETEQNGIGSTETESEESAREVIACMVRCYMKRLTARIVGQGE